jgi:drug/metabolite transporter (DMT)-like permease
VGIILVQGELLRILEMSFVTGDLYILAMATVFSLSQIIVSKFLFHVNATNLTTTSTTIALILFLIFSAPELSTSIIPSAFNFWASVLFMGILGTGFAYTSFYYCIVKLGATTSALFMNLIPFFTVLLAIPFGDEILISQLVGGTIIISGLYLFGSAR